MRSRRLKGGPLVWARARVSSGSVCELSLGGKLHDFRRLGSHEYFVVLVTSCFRYLASAPKVRCLLGVLTAHMSPQGYSLYLGSTRLTRRGGDGCVAGMLQVGGGVM